MTTVRTRVASAATGFPRRWWRHAPTTILSLWAAVWPMAPHALDLRLQVPGGEAQPSRALAEPAELSLRDALALTFDRNPSLAAFTKEREAAEAAASQAGALPNPVLDIAADNLRNVRKAEAGDRSTTIQIGQLVELGGKRGARVGVAAASRDLAAWDYEARRIELGAQATQRFVDLLEAQQRRALADESLELARQVGDAVAKRVQAGKVSPVEETKARLAQAGSDVELEQARRELNAARRALGALWANPDPRFERAVGDLESPLQLPALHQLSGRVRDNPALARWSSEVARRRAGVDVESAKAFPDVTVTAGVTRFSQFDDRAWSVGVSLPLPLFDRNRGGVLEASRRLAKAGDEYRAEEVRLLAELSQAYERLAAIIREIEVLRATLLPGARSAFEAAARGYELGKFGFLDVLDAQRTLFQTRTQYLRALADGQRGVSEIERLVGGPLNPSSDNRSKP